MGFPHRGLYGEGDNNEAGNDKRTAGRQSPPDVSEKGVRAGASRPGNEVVYRARSAASAAMRMITATACSMPSSVTNSCLPW